MRLSTQTGHRFDENCKRIYSHRNPLCGQKQSVKQKTICTKRYHNLFQGEGEISGAHAHLSTILGRYIFKGSNVTELLLKTPEKYTRVPQCLTQFSKPCTASLEMMSRLLFTSCSLNCTKSLLATPPFKIQGQYSLLGL